MVKIYLSIRFPIYFKIRNVLCLLQVPLFEKSIQKPNNVFQTNQTKKKQEKLSFTRNSVSPTQNPVSPSGISFSSENIGKWD